ncbi:NB-ARC domain-containing disease resistance protein [Melia azedarach]|uniref:NB-ARC domain-containing disease resistance protein n=1 Tax=Melia azedarach TaxID=155640 RepID=A0ACC1YMS6_MELAZ|nr:NB-ARC domain-containing disease resistance protein [Melia azedarach]
MLQPRINIKTLRITGYGGKRFPVWLGDPSFSSMETLELSNCKNCTSLPALGLFRSLKHLTIRQMRGLKKIGCETYGKDCSKPFESLETLHFEVLPEWEYWDTSKQNGYVEVFPRLIELSVVGCNKLSGKLPGHLPSLETLVLKSCEELSVLPDHLPSLQTLAVKYCQELVVSFSSFPALSRLEVEKCKGMVCSNLIDSKLIKSVIISSSALYFYGWMQGDAIR